MQPQKTLACASRLATCARWHHVCVLAPNPVSISPGSNTPQTECGPFCKQKKVRRQQKSARALAFGVSNKTIWHGGRREKTHHVNRSAVAATTGNTKWWHGWLIGYTKACYFEVDFNYFLGCICCWYFTDNVCVSTQIYYPSSLAFQILRRHTFKLKAKPTAISSQITHLTGMVLFESSHFQCSTFFK